MKTIEDKTSSKESEEVISHKEISKETDPSSNHEQVKELQSKAEKLITNEDSESHTNDKDAKIPKETKKEAQNNSKQEVGWSDSQSVMVRKDKYDEREKSDEVINHEELDNQEERTHPKDPKPTRGRSESYSTSVNDHTNPEGWKSRERDENTSGNIFFPPTSGQQFNNKKSGLQYVLKQKGREKSQDLPHGWMLKNTKHKTRLKNLMHQILTNMILVLWIIGQSRGSKERFNNNNLPSGWKLGIGTNELDAPDSHSITSKENVLQYRSPGNHSAKEARGRTYQVRFEGWKSHHNIPVGWSRKDKPYRNEQGVNTDIVFSSTSGQLSQSIRAGLEHMKPSTEYTDNQTKAIGKQFLKQNSREKMNQDIWLDDANRPPGWKSKIAEEEEE